MAESPYPPGHGTGDAAHHQPRRTWVVWVHRGDRWGWTPKRLTWSRDRAVQAGRRLKGKPRWCVTTGLASPTKDTATGAVLGDEE